MNSAVTPIVFCDTETTGLDPSLHEIWELAALKVDPRSGETLGELCLQLEVTLESASEKALEIGGFHERFETATALPPAEALGQLCGLAEGAVLAGLNISFDTGFLRPALHRAGIEPSWHYSPIDVKSMAGLAAGLEPPYSSDELAAALKVDPGAYDRHEALADCYYARDLYVVSNREIVALRSTNQQLRARNESLRMTVDGLYDEIDWLEDELDSDILHTLP